MESDPSAIPTDASPEALEMFRNFPKYSQPPVDLRVAVASFVGLSNNLPGSFHFPELIVTDMRLRLVQLHEFMHGFCCLFSDAIQLCLKNYLLSVSSEWANPAPITALVVLDKSQQPSPGFTLIKSRGDQQIGYATLSTGSVAFDTVLAQYEELFVDFLCFAAAGPAYWTTMLDVETRAAPLDQVFNSQWNIHQPRLYDPHPPLMARFILFPQMFLKVFASADGLAGESPVETEKMVASMRTYLQQHVWAHLPTADTATMITYENPNAPAPVQKISFAFESLIPLYHAVCRGYSLLLARWLKQSHPLSLFRWWFFATEHHHRIANLSTEFAQGVPRQLPGNNYFDAIAGSAAARQCYDQNPNLPLEDLQQRADAFQQGMKKSLIKLHIKPPPPKGTRP